MGLDSYLFLRKDEYSSSLRAPGKALYPEEIKSFEEEIKERNPASVSTERYYKVGYWRKFWPLHNWIVNNCAKGVDDCRMVDVWPEQLNELISELEIISKNQSKAKDLLPDDNYDEWYFDNIRYALALFKKLKAFLDDKYGEYYLTYRGSW